ncbi:hypothetical protein [Dactylosporangium sp. CA-092794]|uniref:hypothetical protein n=1 Tax=Dactylosporangium sp. CA-092794 TaxID=3239929 RepID=UPI003D909EC5
MQTPPSGGRRAPRHLRHGRRGRHTAVRSRIGRHRAAALVVFAAIGALFVIGSPGGPPDIAARAEPAVRSDTERVLEAERRASRGGGRTGDQPSRSPSAAPTASPTGGKTPAAPGSASPPAVIAAVGGLTRAEMNNAVTIIRAGQALDLPQRGFVVAIATALQESHLHNLANANVPASLSLPNEGVGSDHDSVGLFQQRPSWGTVAQLMNPAEAARRFYAALVQVSGWEQLAVTVAAQTVQVSAFPDAYAQWQSLAEQIVAAVVPG